MHECMYDVHKYVIYYSRILLPLVSHVRVHVHLKIMFFSLDLLDFLTRSVSQLLKSPGNKRPALGGGVVVAFPLRAPEQKRSSSPITESSL